MASDGTFYFEVEREAPSKEYVEEETVEKQLLGFIPYTYQTTNNVVEDGSISVEEFGDIVSGIKEEFEDIYGDELSLSVRYQKLPRRADDIVADSFDEADKIMDDLGYSLEDAEIFDAEKTLKASFDYNNDSFKGFNDSIRMQLYLDSGSISVEDTKAYKQVLETYSPLDDA